MNYRFVFTAWFNRNLKRLSRRNRHFRTDLELFLSTLNVDLHPIIPHTDGARKARMKSAGRGKSGGYRVIYYFAEGDAVWLLTIYSKVSQENLSSSDYARIRQLIQEIKQQNR